MRMKDFVKDLVDCVKMYYEVNEKLEEDIEAAKKQIEEEAGKIKIIGLQLDKEAKELV